MSKKKSRRQVRTLTVTIVEPVDSSTVGPKFDALGTSNATAGTPINVELIDAAGVVIDTRSNNLDSEGTWGVEFDGVAAGGYTVKASFAGLTSPPTAAITVADFAVMNPAANGDLPTSCTVVGCCEALGDDPDLTVLVTYDDGTTVVEQEAVTNPGAQTWEAYFPTLPSGSGELTAECSDGQTDTSAGLTVAEVVTVESPAEGEVIDISNTLPAAAAAAAKIFRGKVANPLHQVFVCATRRGKRFRAPIQLTPNATTGKWSINYKRLFRGSPVPGKFFFHVMVRNPLNGKRHYASSGRFRLKP